MSRYANSVAKIEVKDVRFPTSLQSDGSDAMHVDPDYSCAYVTVITSDGQKGYGLTFTIGKGTEVVVNAVKVLTPLVVGRKLEVIYSNFAEFWRELTSDSQLRWIGPEKGVIHLATAALVNAMWDLWARIEGKPLWKLLSDMHPEQLISTIDFRYITDALSQKEAFDILTEKAPFRTDREREILESGYPAYCTSVGWIGYNEEKIRQLCKVKLEEGFKSFKAKVGQDLESDRRRLDIIRNEIGWKNKLMVDANQKWDVSEAILWMKELAQFKPLWIEEPTSPDDVLGHRKISQALKEFGIGVATGEQCQNRVMFKQFLQSMALQFCQIDCCRLGGVNEVLAVYLMASKFGVPVCPHAGGVGLCELVQHVAIWDYNCVSGTTENRMIEYVEHLHEHFKTPVVIKNGKYQVPTEPGFGCEMKEESVSAFEYPSGSEWKRLFNEGLFPRPS